MKLLTVLILVPLALPSAVFAKATEAQVTCNKKIDRVIADSRIAIQSKLFNHEALKVQLQEKSELISDNNSDTATNEKIERLIFEIEELEGGLKLIENTRSSYKQKVNFNVTNNKNLDNSIELAKSINKVYHLLNLQQINLAGNRSTVAHLVQCEGFKEIAAKNKKISEQKLDLSKIATCNEALEAYLSKSSALLNSSLHYTNGATLNNQLEGFQSLDKINKEKKNNGDFAVTSDGLNKLLFLITDNINLAKIKSAEEAYEKRRLLDTRYKNIRTLHQHITNLEEVVLQDTKNNLASPQPYFLKAKQLCEKKSASNNQPSKRARKKPRKTKANR